MYISLKSVIKYFKSFLAPNVEVEVELQLQLQPQVEVSQNNPS